MRRIRLGRTNLQVAAIGFGGIPIQRLGEEDAIRLIRRALDLGVDFIDTAHGYTVSEGYIGKAIAGRREGLVLASKSPARDGATFREHLDMSLARLGVAHMDIYQFHNVSKPEQLEAILAPGGAMEVARAAQAAGVIGHIGVTSHSLEMAKTLVASDLFATVMFPFNFISNEPARELLPLCRQHDVGFIDMKPLGGGLLEDARLCFKYLGQFPDIATIPGTEKISEIEEIVAIAEEPAGLTAEERARIVALTEELGTRFCRRCDYCQPCPESIQISTILSIGSALRRFPLERQFDGHTLETVRAVDNCRQCGDCESRCPYELPIRRMLRENADRYEAARAAYLRSR